MAKTKIVLLYEKIKSVFKAKGMSGKHLTGFVPYGYLWDEKRENWIADSEAADVVRHIYAMTLGGYDPFQIASRLTAAQKRAGELERLVCKIYEDNALDRMPGMPLWTHSTPRSRRRLPLKSSSWKRLSAATTRERNRRKSLLH